MIGEAYTIRKVDGTESAVEPFAARGPAKDSIHGKAKEIPAAVEHGPAVHLKWLVSS